MTPDTLIAEGRRLARPCVFLRPEACGPVAAIWHNPDAEEIDSTGFRRWITVDTRFVPCLPKDVLGFISVLTDERRCEGGRIEIHASPPEEGGVKLHAEQKSVLAPIEAIFSRGSDEIGHWLAANRWPREERYNDNFPDRSIVEIFMRQWMKEYPIYRNNGTYAVLGGWHFPCADNDWYRLVDEQLIVLTIYDSEPWVEGWRLRSGHFEVIQRIS